MAKQDTDTALSQGRDQILTLNQDANQVEFLENKLKQFDQQIVENQDFIAHLQADLLKCQESNKMLTHKVQVVEGLKEGEVGKQIQVYQEEIMQITNQFQMEIAELRKQVQARDKDIEYQKNSVVLKAGQHRNELAL